MEPTDTKNFKPSIDSLKEDSQGVTRQESANTLNVGIASVDRASRVLKEAPHLVSAITGEKSQNPTGWLYRATVTKQS